MLRVFSCLFLFLVDMYLAYCHWISHSNKKECWEKKNHTRGLNQIRCFVERHLGASEKVIE